MLLGGRTAEELVFGDITTGASDDIERCTEIARAMVTTYGMSERLGPQHLGGKPGEVFLGKDYGHEATYSDEIAGLIDDEVRRLIDHAHDRARFILTTHRATLDRLAAALVEKETLDDADLAEVFGDIDKGAGIEVSVEELERTVPTRPARRRAPVDALVAEATGHAETRPAPPAPAEPGWRRVLRRWGLGAGAPRPSGT
jgi:cell division protease FtsH